MKISELNGLLKPEKEDYIPIVDDSEKETKKVSMSALLDLFYPVGSYYVTSDTDFNPNKSWGGTWNLDNDGTALVSQNLETGSLFNKELGTIIGNEKHSHKYGIQLGLHYDEITTDPNSLAGIVNYLEDGTTNIMPYEGHGIETMGVNSSTEKATKADQVTIFRYSGQNEYVSSIQPSKIVNRWHREA